MAGRILPSKVGGYLRRLALNYASIGHETLRDIVGASRYFVRADAVVESDFGETTFGHDVVLFVPLSVLGNLTLKDDAALRQRLREDLNACAAAISSEQVRAVGFEVEDEADTEFQQSRTASSQASVNPDTLSFWKPGEIRLFISHRDSHKRDARALSDALSQYGISAFVAHDTIQPMSTWRDEIRKGLETMEVMLAFVTDDFADSSWTNQEIGFALGKGVPIISLQLQSRAPSGFIESTQAIKARISDPAAAVADIYNVLADKLGNRDRLQIALVAAFVASPHFNETIKRFDRMAELADKLSDRELSMIITGFAENDQLYNCGYLRSRHHRLLDFLKRTTGREFEFHGSVIREVRDEDEMPF